MAEDEAILVVLDAAQITRLRRELNGDGDRVLFADRARRASCEIPVAGWRRAPARRTSAEDRRQDLVLAVNEITTNSVVHGRESGTVSVWHEDATALCEVRDDGQIADPLAGRRRPLEAAVGGGGPWIANQVCDLVQVRTFKTGGVVRMHMRLAGADSR